MRGLYAITDPGLTPAESLSARVEAVLRGGARVIQYRYKGADTARRTREARGLLNLCHRHRARLIINDDVRLAHEIGADGVHLGKDDGSVDAARRLLRADAVIGVSCYNSLERALSAQNAGADYVAFGRFFPSHTKPDAVQAEPALLTQAKLQVRLPLVAIGGITVDNGGELIAAGADMLAVIHGVFGTADCERAAQGFAALFTDSPTTAAVVT